VRRCSAVSPPVECLGRLACSPTPPARSRSSSLLPANAYTSARPRFPVWASVRALTAAARWAAPAPRLPRPRAGPQPACSSLCLSLLACEPTVAASRLPSLPPRRPSWRSTSPGALQAARTAQARGVPGLRPTGAKLHGPTMHAPRRAVIERRRRARGSRGMSRLWSVRWAVYSAAVPAISRAHLRRPKVPFLRPSS